MPTYHSIPIIGKRRSRDDEGEKEPDVSDAGSVESDETHASGATKVDPTELPFCEDGQYLQRVILDSTGNVLAAGVPCLVKDGLFGSALWELEKCVVVCLTMMEVEDEWSQPAPRQYDKLKELKACLGECSITNTEAEDYNLPHLVALYNAIFLGWTGFKAIGMTERQKEVKRKLAAAVEPLRDILEQVSPKDTDSLPAGVRSHGRTWCMSMNEYGAADERSRREVTLDPKTGVMREKRRSLSSTGTEYDGTSQSSDYSGDLGSFTVCTAPAPLSQGNSPSTESPAEEARSRSPERDVVSDQSSVYAKSSRYSGSYLSQTVLSLLRRNVRPARSSLRPPCQSKNKTVSWADTTSG